MAPCEDAPKQGGSAAPSTDRGGFTAGDFHGKGEHLFLFSYAVLYGCTPDPALISHKANLEASSHATIRWKSGIPQGRGDKGMMLVL